MKSPLYKTGDVVQHNGEYTLMYPYLSERVPMIVLKTKLHRDISLRAYHICHVLNGDIVVHIDEYWLELVQ